MLIAGQCPREANELNWLNLAPLALMPSTHIPRWSANFPSIRHRKRQRSVIPRSGVKGFRTPSEPAQ